MSERAYLLSVGGELGRFSASTDCLESGFDGSADELFSRSDNGVDLMGEEGWSDERLGMRAREM
jgi:hypothetical protein